MQSSSSIKNLPQNTEKILKNTATTTKAIKGKKFGFLPAALAALAIIGTPTAAMGCERDTKTKNSVEYTNEDACRQELIELRATPATYLRWHFNDSNTSTSHIRNKR